MLILTFETFFSDFRTTLCSIRYTRDQDLSISKAEEKKIFCYDKKQQRHDWKNFWFFFTFFTCCVELEHFLSRFVKMGRFRNKRVQLGPKSAILNIFLDLKIHEAHQKLQQEIISTEKRIYIYKRFTMKKKIALFGPKQKLLSVLCPTLVAFIFSIYCFSYLQIS